MCQTVHMSALTRFAGYIWDLSCCWRSLKKSFYGFSYSFHQKFLDSMGCWSPSDAMAVYMHTLQLCKDYYSKQESTRSSLTVIEPRCMEFVSALAAGNQARLVVAVESGGVSPCTLALAVAARHMRGHLICVRHKQEELDEAKSQIESFNLEDAVEFKLGKPSEVIRQLKDIDFAFIDHKVEDCMEIFLALDMNPRGSVVVVSNLFNGRRTGASYGQLVKGRGGAESVVLPIGEGMEVTRIGKDGMVKGGKGVGRKPKRTFLMYEQYLTDVSC